tara:strand:- start:96 stop:629 length:534 start_codon:yes stop_codon:yes gene_type:complete
MGIIEDLFWFTLLGIVVYLGFIRPYWRMFKNRFLNPNRCSNFLCLSSGGETVKNSPYCRKCIEFESEKSMKSSKGSYHSNIYCKNCGKKLAQKDSLGKNVAKKTGGTGAGFALGATIGTIVLPGWGTVIGAGLGAKEGFDVGKQIDICDSCQPQDYTYQSRCSNCSRSSCNGCGDEF